MFLNLRKLFNNNVAKIILVIYTALIFFWFWILSNGFQEGVFNNLYGAFYPLISLIGGLYGIFYLSKKWGGYKSVIGKGIFFLSLGLLAEVFGQWAWTYYTMIQKIEVPYPSIADIGYFAIIPLYSYAMYNFAKASGVKIGLKSFFGKIQAIIIPLIMVSIAYFLFFKNISLDFSNPLKTFFDFGYPGFEIIAVSIAILTYSLSRNIDGGIIRSKILFIILALIFQYITDYTFLYQVATGTYYNGGIVDLLYTTSFVIMTLAIIQLGSSVENIKSDGLMESPNTGGLNVGLVGTVPILNQIILAIIKRQERVAGQIAWEEAKEVPELTIVDQQKEEISVDGNSAQGSRKVIDDLVSRYKHIFGDLAVQVSKDAAKHLLAELPQNEVPDSLK